jgi:hypothetical protein
LHKLPEPGLPDGLFSNQISEFGQILEGLAIEDVGIFYEHLVHFTVFCHILWTFGIVHGNLVYFSCFGVLCKEKSGNPAQNCKISSNNYDMLFFKLFFFLCNFSRTKQWSQEERPVVYNFFKNSKSCPFYFATFFGKAHALLILTEKYGFGYFLGDFFSQNHLVVRGKFKSLPGLPGIKPKNLEGVEKKLLVYVLFAHLE